MRWHLRLCSGWSAWGSRCLYALRWVESATGRPFDRSRQTISRQAMAGSSPAASVLAERPVRLSFERLDLLVDQLAVLLADLTQIDVLPDMPGLGIDTDRAARAHPLQAFHSLQRLDGIALSVRRLDHLVEDA